MFPLPGDVPVPKGVTIPPDPLVRAEHNWKTLSETPIIVAAGEFLKGVVEELGGGGGERADGGRAAAEVASWAGSGRYRCSGFTHNFFCCEFLFGLFVVCWYM